MKRPVTLWILIFWMILLAFGGGLYGGGAMLLDPSGGSLQLTEILPLLPVSNYILPGLFLLFGMGLFPLFLVYGLLARPNFPWLESLLRSTKYHWAWTGTLVFVAILALWLIVEGALIGFKWAIQYITAINGAFILLFALLPSTQNFFRR